MAFFKFRKTGADSDALAAQPESIEALRKRAKQRLIGASLLVLVGVIGFPLVFDTQPRPIPVDIPIDIPDRGKGAGATNSAVGAVGVAAPAASAPAAADAPAFVAPVPEPSVAARPAASATAASAPSVAPASAPASTAARPAADASAPATRAAASAAEADRARALLEGKPASAALEGRFVVQVGAFAETARAREARQKLEKAGLKTYTQVAETKEGKRIRVRLGPFESRAEADKAARDSRLVVASAV
ncbi:MAG: SPOR domain-containing protein, partial [Ramlibacter sp.]